MLSLIWYNLSYYINSYVKKERKMEEIVRQIKKQQQVRVVLVRTICSASPASRLIRRLFCNQAVAFFYANTRLFFCLNEL